LGPRVDLADVTPHPAACEVIGMRDDLDVSVVISTYDRADVLPHALASLLQQEPPGLRYEMIVVDNNSADSTRAVVESFIARGCPNLSYLFEPRQGVAYGRNTGLLASNAPIVAFTDDDLRVTPNWVSTIKAALNEHPEVDYVGGKVLPSSHVGWPTWLTREHWAPLALFNYGDSCFYVNGTRSVCLGTGNSAYRRAVFDQIGLFAPHVQAIKREAATEDHELQLRLWRSGRQGLYLPTLTVMSDIVSDRLTKAHHRRWHQRHGHFMAIMHDDATEQTRVGRLFGVPAHIYRRGAGALVRGLRDLLRGDLDRAFLHEIQLRFCLGFIGTRWRETVSRVPDATNRRSPRMS